VSLLLCVLTLSELPPTRGRLAHSCQVGIRVLPVLRKMENRVKKNSRVRVIL
jgi:hypothetical protein